MISFVMSCAGMLASRSPRTLLLALLGGLLLAGACWFVCINYYRLWNKRYRINAVHHALCGIAAVMTMSFTVVFVSMRYTRDITERRIADWYAEAKKDKPLMLAAFKRGYQAVKASGLEDFTGKLPADDPKAYIPVTGDATRRIASQAYVDQTTDDFRRKNPFLVRALSLPPAPIELIMRDRANYTRNDPKIMYPVVRAVDVSATHLRNSLLPQAPKTVYQVRTLAAALFVLFQLIPFAAIGFSAYRDLKEQA